MPNFWIHTPPDAALSDIRAWASMGGDRYAVVRHHLLVVPKTGKTVNGPIHSQVDWPIDAKYQTRDKITRVTTYTYNLQESITSNVASKVSQELLSKINSGISLELEKLGASLGSELQTRIGTELVESLQVSLSTTSTYSVEVSTEKEQSLEFQVPAYDGSSAVRPVITYFKLRQLFWDVYLYRTDYLQLRYKKSWIWPDVRKTIVHESIPIQQPLFRIEFFEPYPSFSFALGRYQPDVEQGDAVSSVPLTTPCPPAAIPETRTLEQLAKLAFPVSRTEKVSAENQKKKLAGAAGASSRPAGRGRGVVSANKAASPAGGSRQRTASFTGPAGSAKSASPGKSAGLTKSTGSRKSGGPPRGKGGPAPKK